MLKKLIDREKKSRLKETTSWPNFAIRACDVDVCGITCLKNILDSLVPPLGQVLWFLEVIPLASFNRNRGLATGHAQWFVRPDIGPQISASCNKNREAIYVTLHYNITLQKNGSSVFHRVDLFAEGTVLQYAKCFIHLWL